MSIRNRRVAFWLLLFLAPVGYPVEGLKYLWMDVAVATKWHMLCYTQTERNEPFYENKAFGCYWRIFFINRHPDVGGS